MNTRNRETIRKLLDSLVVPFVSYVSSKLPLRQAPLPRGNHELEVDALRRMVAAKTPDNPCLRGFKVFSQNDEDGIVEEILQRIARKHALNRKFIEIGCGDGLENNSHYLLLKDFAGYWIEGDGKNLEVIRSHLGALDFPSLRIRQHFVDRENVAAILADAVHFIGTREPDFFSLDIDGNDLWILKQSLQHLSPKVIGVEYNPKFPPPMAVSIAYNPSHTWNHDDYHGASLQAFCDGIPDYQLVCCNLCGVNAFFVRRDVAGDFPPADAAALYQPFREHLTCPMVGHPPSFGWLRDRLTKRL